MNLVFFGTPAFAVPSLDALANSDHNLLAVVAQPDRASGRGLGVQRQAVAARATELGVSLLQPERVREESFLRVLKELCPDLAVVVAYGKILPTSLLEIPLQGAINVHASLLPNYRGAAPIQRAIENGDSFTGVSIMKIDEQLDHGPVLLQQSLKIGERERASELAVRLADAGAGKLLEALGILSRDEAVWVEQKHEHSTHAAKVEKGEGRVNWSDSALVIYNRFRAFYLWPGLFFNLADETVKVLEMELAPEVVAPETESGIVVEVARGGVTITTGNGAIRLITLQRPGKRGSNADEVFRSRGIPAGTRLE